MHRFEDNGKYNGEFQNEISVCCPKCNSQALITSGSVDQSGLRATCHKCGFNEHEKDGRWYGTSIGIASRRCSGCGRWLDKRTFGPRHLFQFKLTCPGCGCVMIEPITWYKSGPGTVDPYFGLKLWFIGNIKGNEFWAFNREHLSFIRNYVSAKVRIRTPNKNSSLVSRLPSWLLSKKNRVAVLKEIARISKL